MQIHEEQKTFPTTLVVPRAEVKEYLYVTTTDHDDEIDRMILKAQAKAGSILHYPIVATQFEYRFDKFPDGAEPIRLPRYPLQTIDEFDYTDSAQATIDIASDVGFHGHAMPPEIYYDTNLGVWPTDWYEYIPRPVRLLATVGFEDAAHVPDAVKMGILWIVGANFEGRRDDAIGRGDTMIPSRAEDILCPLAMERV